MALLNRPTMIRRVAYSGRGFTYNGPVRFYSCSEIDCSTVGSRMAGLLDDFNEWMMANPGADPMEWAGWSRYVGLSQAHARCCGGRS
jgi:hypothetical protein